MAAQVQVQISSLLEKMTSLDKDFRFMATNDLMCALVKDALKLDDEIERKITRTLLKLLDDKNGEVQNLAVRCLGPLVQKAKPANVAIVIDTLCSSLNSQTERSRDVSSIALKTAVNELSPQLPTNLAKDVLDKVLPNLLSILREDGNQDAAFKIEVTDILGILIEKFGHNSNINFPDLVDVLFYQLSRDRQALRKRATNVLGMVADVVDETMYGNIVQRVLGGIQTSQSSSVVRAYVLAAATISKSSPAFVFALPDIISSLIQHCRVTDDDELKDAAVHAFEVFITHCNRKITPFLADIEDICSEFIKYDPNYQYDDEDDDVSMEIDSDVGDADDDLDEYSDDDDFSWKARRSAAKCYEALINYRPDRLEEHYKKLGPLLLSRFKEREESVKLDVFRAYEALLKQTRLYLPDSLAQFDNSTNISPFTVLGGQHTVFTHQLFQKVLDEDVDAKQKAVLQAVIEQTPKFVKAVCRQLKSKSASVRLHCYSLLTSSVRALPGCLTNHFHQLVPLIKHTMMEKQTDNATRIDTLQFLNLSFCSHEPQVFEAHLDSLTSLIISCVNESFYKVSAAALIVLQSLVVVLKSLNEERQLPEISTVIIEKLKVSDIDQEVKERAIAAAGVLLANFGSKLGESLSQILPLLLDKIGNETTRPTTVQAFCVVVKSCEAVELTPVLEPLLLQLSDFLRKNQRALRISSLSLLSSIVKKYESSSIPPQGVDRVIRELPELMCESDLYISQLSLKLSKDLTAKFPNEISSSLSLMIDACVHLANNSLLVGNMLNWAVELFTTIVKGDIPGKPSFTVLLDKLTSHIYSSEKVSRQVYSAVAVIMAHSTKAANDEQLTRHVVSGLVQVLRKDENDMLPLFGLTTLGELGRVYPECFAVCNVNAADLITTQFKSASEETKTIASNALGALSSGDLAKYLPLLLDQIKTQPKRQYLYLHALKEVISSQAEQEVSSDVFMQVTDDIWSVLMGHSDCPEESTRTVVAECMGRMCRMQPNRLLPLLIECSKTGTQKQRSTAAGAFRFMIVDSKAVHNEYLRENLGQLLTAIDDDDLDIRRTSIMTLNSAAHNKPRWVKELLPGLLPSLYRETEIKTELVHEVQMGPFKHVVDDGLDLRKSAYECMYTLLEHCLDRINVSEYMSKMERGLQDSHDIKLLNLLMLTRLAQTCGPQAAQRIDRFAELLAPLLVLKAKEASVKQESDKIEELKRACIRTILSLKRIPAMDRSARLQQCYETVQADQKLKAILESLEKDNTLKLLSVHNQDIPMETEY